MSSIGAILEEALISKALFYGHCDYAARHVGDNDVMSPIQLSRAWSLLLLLHFVIAVATTTTTVFGDHFN